MAEPSGDLAAPARCPRCKNYVHYHCANTKCDWMICKACNHYGRPGADWIPRLFGGPDAHG